MVKDSISTDKDSAASSILEGYKILLLGSEGVGKSSLVMHFLAEEWMHNLQKILFDPDNINNNNLTSPSSTPRMPYSQSPTFSIEYHASTPTAASALSLALAAKEQKDLEEKQRQQQQQQQQNPAEIERGGASTESNKQSATTNDNSVSNFGESVEDYLSSETEDISEQDSFVLKTNVPFSPLSLTTSEDFENELNQNYDNSETYRRLHDLILGNINAVGSDGDIRTSATTDDTHFADKLMLRLELEHGLTLFNQKGEKGIRYLVKKGIIQDTPQEITKFLHTSTGISISQIGEYVGNKEHVSIGREYAKGFDFRGLSFENALRYYLSQFRLPKEGQQIARILEFFAEAFYEQNVVAAANDNLYNNYRCSRDIDSIIRAYRNNQGSGLSSTRSGGSIGSFDDSDSSESSDLGGQTPVSASPMSSSLSEFTNNDVGLSSSYGASLQAGSPLSSSPSNYLSSSADGIRRTMARERHGSGGTIQTKTKKHVLFRNSDDSYDRSGSSISPASASSQTDAKIPGRKSNKAEQQRKPNLESTINWTPESILTLAYSVLLLNTDAYTTTVKNKMTKHQFIKNLQGMNGGEDFPKEYLEKLYKSIYQKEIKVLADDTSSVIRASSKDCYRKHIRIGYKVHPFYILDDVYPAGQNIFTSLLDSYIMQGHGFMLCYSVTDRKSFDMIQKLRRSIVRCKDTEIVPMVLVSCKNDCDESAREVTSEEGENLARSLGISFFETTTVLLNPNNNSNSNSNSNSCSDTSSSSSSSESSKSAALINNERQLFAVGDAFMTLVVKVIQQHLMEEQQFLAEEDSQQQQQQQQQQQDGSVLSRFASVFEKIKR